MKLLQCVWRCTAGDAEMEWKHREGVQTAHGVSNWNLSLWFLTCATCSFFVWSHRVWHMFEKHIFYKCTSLFFSKQITSVKQKKNIKEMLQLEWHQTVLLMLKKEIYCCCHFIRCLFSTAEYRPGHISFVRFTPFGSFGFIGSKCERAEVMLKCG